MILSLSGDGEPLTLGDDFENVFEDAWGCRNRAGCRSELGRIVSIFLVESGFLHRRCAVELEEGSFLPSALFNRGETAGYPEMAFAPAREAKLDRGDSVRWDDPQLESRWRGWARKIGRGGREE